MPPSAPDEAESLYLTQRLAHMKTLTDAGLFSEYARETLSGLEARNNDECSRLQLELARSAADLVAARSSLSSVVAEQEMERAELASNQSLLAEQDSKVQSLEVQINQTRDQVESLRNKIRDEEKRRSNALYDLIPFHGLFAGIFSGDWKRAIPLYSQIDGIISAFKEDLAEAENTERSKQNEVNGLQQQSNETKNAIEMTKQRIAELEADAVKYRQQLGDYDNASKEIGKEMTTLQGSRVRMEILKVKYGFLQSAVQDIIESKEGSLIDECITDFLELQHA